MRFLSVQANPVFTKCHQNRFSGEGTQTDRQSYFGIYSISNEVYIYAYRE